MNVLTRSYDNARSGANTNETTLTSKKVATKILVKRFSCSFDDDPRLEAQPLYVKQLAMQGKTHDVVYVCTMANNVWAFDANNGHALWAHPTNLGHPITPHPAPHPGFPDATEIDLWGVNKKWGILSTPVIDIDAKTMYVVCWTSADGSVANASYELHRVNIVSGADEAKVTISARADGQAVAGKPVAEFRASGQKQRASLLLTKIGGHTTVFIGFGMTHEEHDPTHGWLLAYDVGGATMKQSAAWCTSPAGSGVGIWQAGQGPSADSAGDIYLMTGNYGVEEADHKHTAAPAPEDRPESIVKLKYTPPSGAGAGSLEPVAWFTPFRDTDRKTSEDGGDDDFQDYDLGSAGPLVLESLDLVVGAGKDGVIYVLPRDTAAFGKGSDFSRLKQHPIFFTYFPGFGIDAANVASLDRLYDGKTHHLHASPLFWHGAKGPMLFCWGENETLRAWNVDAAGNVTFVAKGAEVASAGAHGLGGMPGGLLTLTSDGANPGTAVVWATAPINGDANKFVVDGIVRAYDAETLDPNKNADGTPRLKLLWDSTRIPKNTFHFNKFCPPFVADGKLFVPTYDGRVDVYGFVTPPHGHPLPTNANM